MMTTSDKIAKKPDFYQEAMEYHSQPTAGKISVQPTKSLSNQHDLALAYTPGVAKVCEEIAEKPEASFRYTSRGNLVAVISNGSAVLGLGNIGPLASKPVMEGKAVLFKKFAGIDVFDLEIQENDPEKLVDIIAALEPTFGGINLEDIRAPECFYVEEKLRERCRIPVFHDDQHGTAIVVSAALTNALILIGKELKDVRLVTSGAGAAALACLELLVDQGLSRENIILTDRNGIIYRGRPQPYSQKATQFLTETNDRSLAQALEGADVFLGLSAGGVLKAEYLSKMRDQPVIMALANPYPEIMPEDALAVRPDAVIATGRSDYPNQVNNVLCFPYIFRGALDCGATQITRAMEIATVRALAKIAREEIPEGVAKAYNVFDLSFGTKYLIAKPFDARLISRIAPAVAVAAEQSGVATRPIQDIQEYTEKLENFTTRSGSFMKPIFTFARKSSRKRLVLCEGEEENALRASQIFVDEKLARPVLIARPKVLEQRLKRYGLRLKIEEDFEVVNPESDDRYYEYWNSYHQIAQRQGITKMMARYELRNQPTLIGCMLLEKQAADAMLCGLQGAGAHEHIRYVERIVGLKAGCKCYASLNALILANQQIFLVDTEVNYDPDVEALVRITVSASEQIRMFGIEPRIALLSHANFGASDYPSAKKMRRVYEILRRDYPELQVEGEMQGDLALKPEMQELYLQNSALSQSANLLVFPNLDAANIASNLLKAAAGHNISVGNLLLGAKKPIGIVNQGASVRKIVNLGALVVAQSQHAHLKSSRDSSPE